MKCKIVSLIMNEEAHMSSNIFLSIFMTKIDIVKKITIVWVPLSGASWVIFHDFMSSADFFKKILSGKPSVYKQI